MHLEYITKSFTYLNNLNFLASFLILDNSCFDCFKFRLRIVWIS